jgi:beta-mannosidase
MYSDCWGETGWTLVDYYLRRKASYYWFRRACAPVKAIVRRRGRALVVRVVNDTLRDVTATLESGWVRVDGGGRRLTRERVRIPANGMVEVERVPLPAKSEKDPREWVYAARLSGRDIEDAPSVWALAPHRALRLPRPRIEVRVQGRDIVLQSPAYCHGVHAEDHGRAMLSDNFFDLLPGVPKTIRRVDGKPARGLRFRAVV